MCVHVTLYIYCVYMSSIKVSVLLLAPQLTLDTGCISLKEISRTDRYMYMYMCPLMSFIATNYVQHMLVLMPLGINSFHVI